MGIYDHAMKVQPTPTSPKVRSSENVQALEQLYKDEGLQQYKQPTARKKRFAADGYPLCFSWVCFRHAWSTGNFGIPRQRFLVGQSSLEQILSRMCRYPKHGISRKTTVVKQVSDAGKSSSNLRSAIWRIAAANNLLCGGPDRFSAALY